MKEGEYEFLYKKVDSTLRGDIIAELKAMVEVFQPELVVLLAFPKAGRTTENGIQKVNGTPLLETEMVRDPRNPIAYDNIIKLLSEGLNVYVTHHDLEEVRRDNLTLDNGYHYL